MGYFSWLWRYFYQNLSKYSHWPFSKSVKNVFKYFACVSGSWFICSLKNGKIGYFANFSRLFTKFVDIFTWSYLIDWPKQNFKKILVGLSLGSFVDIMNNISVPFWCNSLKLSTSASVTILVLLNIYIVVMMIVTLRIIWSGTIVTWPSCRPLALFICENEMDIKNLQ